VNRSKYLAREQVRHEAEKQLNASDPTRDFQVCQENTRNDECGRTSTTTEWWKKISCHVWSMCIIFWRRLCAVIVGPIAPRAPVIVGGLWVEDVGRNPGAVARVGAIRQSPRRAFKALGHRTERQGEQ